MEIIFVNLDTRFKTNYKLLLPNIFQILVPCRTYVIYYLLTEYYESKLNYLSWYYRFIISVPLESCLKSYPSVSINPSSQTNVIQCTSKAFHKYFPILILFYLASSREIPWSHFSWITVKRNIIKARLEIYCIWFLR